VIAQVVNSGGIAYAEEAMKEYQNRALSALATLPDNDAKQALIQLVNYTIERKK